MDRRRAIRLDIETRLGSLLADVEWEALIAERYVTELEGDQAKADDVVRMVRKRRRTWGSRHGDAARGRPHSALRGVQVKAVSQDPRVQALSHWVAAYVAREDPEVQHFRERVLNGRLLTATEATRWIANRQPQANGRSANPRIRLLGSGTKDLTQLETLAQDLADVYAWLSSDAERFVLTGQVPMIFPLRVETESRRFLPLSRLVLSIDPMLPPHEVAAFYRGARRVFHSRRTRRLSDKHARLALVAVTKARSETWAETLKGWNRTCEPSERYTERSNFVRDCLRAAKRLLRDVGGQAVRGARARSR